MSTDFGVRRKGVQILSGPLTGHRPSEESPPSFGFLMCEMGLSRAFQGVQEGLRKVEEERTRLAQRLVPKSLFKETRRI